MRGIISKYDDGRGFGFIRPAGGRGNDIFFHSAEVISGLESLAPGAPVTFTTQKGEKGVTAVNVAVYKPTVSPLLFFSGATIFIAVAIYIGLELFAPPLHPLIKYLLALNGALFILTGFDKSVAGGASTRVPELVSYFFAALGGGVGLLLGMRFFRHKMRKASFAFVIVLIIGVQVVLLKLLTTYFTV